MKIESYSVCKVENAMIKVRKGQKARVTQVHKPKLPNDCHECGAPIKADMDLCDRCSKLKQQWGKNTL
jgi:hypothetical protein